MTAGAIVATFAASWLFWPPPQETAARFVTRPLERGSVVRAITATGVVRSPPMTEVVAPLTGRVQFRDCKVGAKVAKGQLCATINQRRYRLAVERQRAKLSTARAQLGEREAELARAKSALERARASAKRSRSDKATSAHERALATTRRAEDLVAQREAALHAAESDLARTDVLAPMDGTVIFRGVETAWPVEAGRSKLFVITDNAVAQIDVAVAPDDVDKIEIGDRASMNVDAVAGRAFDGQATEIRRAQNVVILSAPDAKSLLEPGRTVTARIVIDQRVDVLRAPNEALRYSQSRNASQVGVEGEKSDVTSRWVLRQGKPTSAPVRLGLDDGALTEIVESDFEPGDELIVGEKD
jgi:HlyD family secretion protein